MTRAHSLILFDGVCNFCAASVRFVAARDPTAQFRFAPLQSPLARGLLEQHGIDDPDLTSMVLIEGGTAYRKSTAALRIAHRLHRLWPLLYGFILLPRVLRDPIYDFIGRRRYRWFGKTDECWVPDGALAARFVQEPPVEPPRQPRVRASGRHEQDSAEARLRR